MNQQQNQQPQNNELQKKAEDALSATFVMPVIRTMADDLLEVSKGVSVPVTAEAPVVVVKTVQQPTVSVMPVVRQTSTAQKPPVSRPAVFPIPSVTPKPIVGNTVAMPSVTTQADKKSFFVSMLLGGGTAVIIAAVIFAVYIFWPKKTSTIADKIPAETIAFVSIKRGSGALENVVLPKILASMGLDSNALGTKWSDLVYVVIPGSTSSEPVSFLMTDDASSISLGENSNFVLKNLANGNGAIVDAKEAGRLDGLSGKSLGDNGDFRALSSKLPASPEYIYLGPGESASMLSVFSLLTKEQSPAYLFAVAPSTEGGKTFSLMGTNGSNENFVKNQISWETPIKAIPASIIALAGHGSLSASAEQWRQVQSNNPQMQGFLNALTAQVKTSDALKANLADNFVVGTLANTTPIPDGIAVLPLKDGTSALVKEQVSTLFKVKISVLVKEQMSSLEDALKLLGPLIGGAPYSDVVFEDNIYKDVAIRYVNFGDPSRSLDYAIVDSLLLVSTSKTSMEQMIDAYKGDAENFANNFALQSTGQADWQYMRLDENTVGRLPTALKTMLSGFTSTYFEPIKTGVFTGNIAY
ncbi:MAG: hypothetical protein Q7S57_06140 [bacterium]|nr:hypothetical protein [bacterium]